MSEFTARWEAGGSTLTIACRHGRVWAYDVVRIGDRPLPHFLDGLPWMLPPGSEWNQDDGDGKWSAAVIPVSADAAGELFNRNADSVQPRLGSSLPPGGLTRPLPARRNVGGQGGAGGARGSWRDRRDPGPALAIHTQ